MVYATTIALIAVSIIAVFLGIYSNHSWLAIIIYSVFIIGWIVMIVRIYKQ